MTHTSRPPIHSPAPHHLAMRCAVLILAIVLGGCGIRVETSLPSEPVPDTNETIRRVAVDDALAIKELAAKVSATDPAVQAMLTEAGAFADEHIEALGGVYDSGLGDLLAEHGVAASPTPQASAAPTAAATPEDAATGGVPGPATGTDTTGATTDPGAGQTPGTLRAEALPETADGVITALIDAAKRTRASADLAEDGGFARLLSSIAASESLQARRLGAATGSSIVEEPSSQSALAATPGGLTTAQLTAVTSDEDAAGYSYEVYAATANGDIRERALTAAAAHRARAQTWADITGVDGTDQDPRRIAYNLPVLSIEGLAQQLETDLATTYESLVAAADGDDRGPLSWLAYQSTQTGVDWGGPVTAFPGMPEDQSPSSTDSSADDATTSSPTP